MKCSEDELIFDPHKALLSEQSGAAKIKLSTGALAAMCPLLAFFSKQKY